MMCELHMENIDTGKVIVFDMPSIQRAGTYAWFYMDEGLAFVKIIGKNGREYGLNGKRVA